MNDATACSLGSTGSSTMKIALIACSKTKTYRHDARVGGRILPADLYSGDLFRKAVVHAEDQGLPWFVLSAKFGLWASDQALNAGEYDSATKSWTAYDETLPGMDAAAKAAWHTKVAWDVVNLMWDSWDRGDADAPVQPKEMTVEIHAGKEYTHPLAEILRSVGVNVEMPLEGMQIGERLAWYKHHEINRLAAALS